MTRLSLDKVYKALRSGSRSRPDSAPSGLRSIPRVDRDWLTYEAYVYEFMGWSWPTDAPTCETVCAPERAGREP